MCLLKESMCLLKETKTDGTEKPRERKESQRSVERCALEMFKRLKKEGIIL